MAAIIQEWQAILATCKKIAEKTGAEVPPGLQRMEGDIWGRQAGRLRALSGWLREVENSLLEKPPDEPEGPDAPPDEPAMETLKDELEGAEPPAPKTRKKKAA